MDFNSHTREGVTKFVPVIVYGNGDFNSHTREGVTISSSKFGRIFNFNSHTREGVTEAKKHFSNVAEFQLTHP